MKTILTLFVCVFLATSIMAAETLSFKFSNPRIYYSTGVSYLDFDVLIKATVGDTYLYGTQVVCNVNIANFNTTSNPQFSRGFVGGLYQDEDFKYLYATSWNSDNLNLAVYANPLYNGQDLASGAYSKVTSSWQSLGRIRVKINNSAGLAGISFQSAAMDGYQTFATGIGPYYSDTYASPNTYEGYDFTDLYLNRIFSGGSGWTQAGGTVDWTASVNTSVWDTTASAAVAGTNAMVADLRIHPGGRLLVNPTGNLTVSGTLINASTTGNNGLVLKSTSTGTGSLIHNNTGVNATVERYITAWSSATSGWHLLSSPVLAQPISGTWTPAPASSYDFFAFNENVTTTNEYWLNQKVPSNSITSFIPGKGYLVAYEHADTREFTGALNTASPAVALSYTTGSPFPGWNLVGNPFASALNWDAGSWSGTSVDDIAQVWDESAQSYVTTAVKGNIIPSMNGFMVHASAAGATLTMPASARVHNSANWYKAADENFILLVANDVENGSSQSSIVRFNAESTDGYDAKFDSYFIKGFAPEFYSVAGNELYALNTLPEMNDFLEIPFAFVKNGSGSFSIELAKNLPDAVIYLIDKKTGVMQNLSENPVYNFTAAEGDRPDRFILHFGSQFLGLNPSSANADFSVWYNRGDIRFSTLPEKVLSMSLIDMSGREIVSFGRPETDNISVGKKLALGYYLVRIRMADKVLVKKLFVN